MDQQNVIAVGGVPFRASTLDTAVHWLLGRVREQQDGISIRLANSYCVALTSSRQDYRELLTQQGVNFADGAPVALVMRMDWRKRGLPKDAVGRVRGPSFFELALDQGRSHNFSHFFLGTTPETLALLAESALAKYPGIRLAGSYSPPFEPVDQAFVSNCVSVVNASNADIIWVGLGTPKQDFLTTELARATGKHCVGVGAAFDFSAGTVREAPKWIQDGGIEWLYRLAREPKRLWKRYLVGNFVFVLLVLRKNLFRNQVDAGR